jgi:hypothetical protein
MGNGLDMQPQFRNLHALPLMQTKTDLVDYVSGEYALHRDQLLYLQDGLQTIAVDEPAVATQLRLSLAEFKAKSQRAQSDPSWVAQTEDVNSGKYVEEKRSLHQGQRLAQYKGLTASGLRWTASGPDLTASAWVKHTGDQESAPFVPLLVVTNDKGEELAEVSGHALRLQPGESRELTLNLALPNSFSSRKFVSFVISHPETGKPAGRGQYHVALHP